MDQLETAAPTNPQELPGTTAAMTGRRVVVTGPTSGIGREIAGRLALAGAEVILACRDPEAGAATAAEIARVTGAHRCTVLPLDVADHGSVRAFGRQCRSRFDRIDVLVNNAGTNRTRREENGAGVELTFATNVLGYYLVTEELLDLLRAGPQPRVVNVASSFAKYLDLNDLQYCRRRYDGRKAYAQSKACDRLLTWAFARRLSGSGVTVNAMAPGLVQTGLFRDTPPAVRFMIRLAGRFFGCSVAEGADTAVWLASSPAVAGVTGRFFQRRQEVPCRLRNEAAEKTLWDYCRQLATCPPP